MTERLDPALCWELGLVQQIKHGERICGDWVVSSRQGGSLRLVLSDGLGSGVQANIAATLTATLLCGLTGRGVPLEDCVRSIEAALPVTKRQGLAYATFSLVSAGGQTLELLQFDSPPAVWLRDGVSLPYPSGERAVLDKTVRESRLRFKPGDMLVLFSDGVSEAGRGVTTYAGWEQREMEDYLSRSVLPDDDARHVAARIVSSVQALDLFSFHDDTTVAVLRLRERLRVKLLLGPDDGWAPEEALLRRFFAQEGEALLCGSGVVRAAGAYCGAEPRLLRHTVTETLPPAWEVESAALAMESGQSLREALALLSLYAEDALAALELDQAPDAASRFVALLARQASDVTLFFRAAACDDTRAEQVARLRELLTALGKTVTMEYC